MDLHEDLKHWVDLRTAAGQTSAPLHARYVQAMCNRLHLAPADLPPDAVSLHFAGGGRFAATDPDREAASSSERAYQKALDLWHAFLDCGALSAEAASLLRGIPALDDPRMQAWAVKMRVDDLSENTITAYTTNLERIARWSGVDIAALTEYDVVQYLGTRDLATRTRNLYLQSVSRFYVDHGLPDPTVNIRRGATPPSTPRPIAEEDLAGLLLRSAHDIRTAPHALALRRAKVLRSATILGAYAGLRRFEIVKVAQRDVRKDRQGTWFLTVVGKGQTGKTREGKTIQIPPQVGAEVARWPRIGPIFGPGYTSDALGLQWAAWAASEGVQATMHQLRHRYGTELYRATRDILFVRDQMRHSTTAMTERYVALVPSDDRRAIISDFGRDIGGEDGPRLSLVG